MFNRKSTCVDGKKTCAAKRPATRNMTISSSQRPTKTEAITPKTLNGHRLNLPASPMNTKLSVAETMEQDPLFLTGDETIATAARAMRERGVGAALVQQNGSLQGILTERDIVHKVVAVGLEPAKTPVTDIMTQNVVTIRSDQDILVALRLMRKQKCRRLPVLQEGQLVGLITERGISQVAPELIQIAEDWSTITNSNGDAEYRSILSEEEDLRGACEICGNAAVDLSEFDGSLHCEDCLEAATTPETV
jgi:CBS domain-containing protein